MNPICPRDRTALSGDNRLVCERGHVYPTVDGIPVLIVGELTDNEAIRESLKLAADPTPDGYDGRGVHPQVQAMVLATSGNLYRHLVGKLPRYPIPTLRMEEGRGRTLLDVGCNWGRWTVAAAKRGYRATGLDPHLHSLRAARHVARAEGVGASFVCGDARMMPFADESFDAAFSYSVVQHFSKEDARTLLREMARVLRPGGVCLVQMPHRWGLRGLYHQARRGFGEGQGFDVRYWTRGELARTFSDVFGSAEIKAEGYFGIGVQPDDRDLFTPLGKAVVFASELLRGASLKVPALVRVADSLYVSARKEQPAR